MRLYKLLVSLLTLAAVSTAQAGLPSSVGKAKQVLTVTQKVSATGQSAVSAKVAPLVNATAGFGTTVLRTDVRVPEAIGAIKTLTFPTNVTQQQAVTQATAHFKMYGSVLANQMQTWMTANGVSFAWFSYEQTVNIRVAQYAGSGGAAGGGGGSRPNMNYQLNLMAISPDTGGGGGGGVTNTGALTPGYEERLLIWTMSTDQNGRLLFGAPKLVPPRPKTLYVVYTPLTVDDDLPGSASYPNAGTLFVQTRDEAFAVLPGTDEYINTGGAFDEDTKSFSVDDPATPDVDESLNYSDNIEYASKVKCLMTDGCGALHPTRGTPLSVRQLMDDRGATLAIVEYVHKVKPAYSTTPDADGNFVPVNNRLVIDKRVVTYNGCNDPVYYNKGHYGFSLRTSLTRYIVSADGQYAPIAEKEGEAIGVDPKDDKSYEGTVTVKSTDINKLAAYAINPTNPSSPVLVPLTSLALTTDAAALEVSGDSTPVTLYGNTGYIYTGGNHLNAHVFLQCSADSPLIKFSAGWQDNGANASVNWQPVVNRYTTGGTFTKGKAQSLTISSTEEPAFNARCYGTANYDGNRTVTLNMSENCPYGQQLVHGNYNYTNYYAAAGFAEDGLGSLFPQTCPAGMTYKTVTGDVWTQTSTGSGDNSGTQNSLTPQNVTGCAYNALSGLSISWMELYFYGPTNGGSTGSGDGGSSWGFTGVCPNPADTPVFTASNGYVGYDGDYSNVRYTARTCVTRPVPTWTLSW